MAGVIFGTDVEDVLRVLRDVVRPQMLVHGWPVNSCVASARVCVDVLRAAGHQTRPVSVVLRARRTGDGSSETVTQLGDPVGGRVVGGNWEGHLVAVTGEYLVDLAADQVPGLGPLVLRCPGPPIGAALGSTDGELVVDAGDFEVAYTLLPYDLSFRGTTDWQLAEAGAVTRLRDHVLEAFGLPHPPSATPR